MKACETKKSGDVSDGAYENALKYMVSLGSRRMMLGLERIKTLLDILEHPEEKLRIIHIAGTNGKGSAGAFLASILTRAGYRVGRFVSPAVFDYRERIQVEGRYITKEAFVKCTDLLRNACVKLEESGLELPTQFEMDTAMAFLYFKQTDCDFVLLEVGLGGRQDATNVIDHSLMSVITSVSMDHTKILGEHLWEIAREKAGIIKEKQPVITCRQAPEVMEQLLKECEEKASQLIVADKGLSEAKTCAGDLGECFDYRDLKNLSINLSGVHQIENASLAVEAALVLNRLAYARISEDHIRQGLALARWPGRFDCVSRFPLIIADGAHNPDGAGMLKDTLMRHFPTEKKLLVMGVFADKDYKKMLEIMSGCSDTLIVFRAPTARGLDEKLLAEAAKPYFADILVCRDIEDAIAAAKRLSRPEDVIISFGSLSALGKLYGFVIR